ncbi:MAG TPA: hypothetical protein VFP33_13795 [Gallionella sp.]|nr:hypothetical protein [Gallionella sp.]
MDQLREIAQAILHPEKRLQDLIPAAEALRNLFEQRTGFAIDQQAGIDAGGTRLESGLAISPPLAAMCIRELFRTPAFIRGLGHAIKDALQPDRPVRVLYAGCGSYAALALPLMTAFSSEQVVFTLLDIHGQCLDDAMKLIDLFGLSSHVESAQCADATTWRIPADAMPDIIVTETMAVALHNEPQVSIARNLCAQAPDAIMVPQQISVDVCALDVTKEHIFVPSDHVGAIPEPQRDRMFLGRIFSLDAESIRHWQWIEGDRLPAGQVRIPDVLKKRVLHLMTHIVVYGQTELKDYDCSLTMPRPLRGEIGSGDELQFHYQLGNSPELRYEKREE